MTNHSAAALHPEFHYSTDHGYGAKLANLTVHLHNASGPLGGYIPFPSDDYFGHVLYGVVVPFLFGTVTFLGVLGNSLVIYVICTKQKMRTLTNLLLLNLALADLSFVLICPPFTAYQLAVSAWPVRGPLGDALCKLMHYLLNVTAYVTIYTLLLIAAIRYMTIVHNAATVRYRTKRLTAMLILAIWLVMLAVNAPILDIYGVQVNPYGALDCENYGRDIGQRLYATFFVFAYLLPLSVIAMLSISILVHINNRHRPYTLAAPARVDESRTTVHKRQASRLLVLVVVIFAILWLPVHIHLLVAYFLFDEPPQSNLYRVASVLFNLLAYLNSCVNPIIYNCASKDFRDSFRDAMTCGYRPRNANASSIGGGGGGGGRHEHAYLMTYHNNHVDAAPENTNGNHHGHHASDEDDDDGPPESPGHSPPTVRSVAL